MSLKQDFTHAKTLFTQGSNLLLLRLRVLQLDAMTQISGIIKIVVLVLAIMILLLVGFISLLFGLYVMLPENMKVWVFLGLSAVCCILILIFLYAIPKIWQNNQNKISNTLNDLQHDWQLINNTAQQQEKHIK